VRHGTAPRAALAAVAAACALAFFTGCAGKLPVLSRVYGRVIYAHDPSTNASSETLGVFLVASDPDGMENINAFYVINDDAELFWKVDSATWITATAEGESWIGTTSLMMPGAMPLPAGQYRVVLESVGGDTVEDTITIPVRVLSAADAKYPAAAIEQGLIKVSGAPESFEIWAYGKDGKFVSTFPLSGKSPQLAVQAVTSSSPALAGGFTFRVYAWNEQDGFGVLCGPYSPDALPGK
jgi:hypothetical protein